LKLSIGLDLTEIDESDELFCENDENDAVEDLPIVRNQIELEPYEMILKSEASGKLYRVFFYNWKRSDINQS
jgi:hypothetical protein